MKSGGVWGTRRTGKYGDKIDWLKLEDEMVNVSNDMYKKSPFQRETHDIDQQALRSIIYFQICSLKQHEFLLPRSRYSHRNIRESPKVYTNTGTCAISV
jgi:hypothetical protein